MKILFSFLVCLSFFHFAFSKSPVLWAEEKCDSLGPNNGGAGTVAHSTFHYDLVKLLAIKSGFSSDTAELIARYSALTDQVNPKPGYPNSANAISTADTFPAWNESVCGTERSAQVQNMLGETPAVFWHFALRDGTDTLCGGYVYAGSGYPAGITDTNYTHSPYYWRVPFVYTLTNLEKWSLYSSVGVDGKPPLAPDTVEYYSGGHYIPVPKGSLAALGIFLHSLADSYSHEKCAELDTIRSHPATPADCASNIHHLEIAYTNPSYAYDHTEKCAQAIWRVLREYKRIHALNNPALWIADSNGFADGDGIPDELEDDGDADHYESFMERWKSPAAINLNPSYDAAINHFDHTTHRIQLVDSSLTVPSAMQEIFSGNELPVVSLFPNPVSQTLNMKMNMNFQRSLSVSVVDISGKKLISTVISPSEIRSGLFSLDVHEISNGSYILIIQADQLMQTKEFIIKK